MNYYRVVKGRLCPAPENIRLLIGEPTERQYLFFGYKPLADDGEEVQNESQTYIEEETVIRRVVS